MSDSKFFSFRKPSDWMRGAAFHLHKEKSGFTVARDRVYRMVRKCRLTDPQLASAVIDTSFDRDGGWFLLDEEGIIWRADPAGNHVEAINQSGPSDFNRGMRLAATPGAIVLAGTGPDSVIHWMTPDRGQIRWSVSDWYGEPMHILAVAPDADGGIAALTAGEGGTLHLLRFDWAGMALDRIAIPLPEEHGAGDAADGENRFYLAIGDDGFGRLLDIRAQRIAMIGLKTGVVDWLAPAVDAETETLAAVCAGEAGTVWALTRMLDGAGASRCALVRIGPDGKIAERGFPGSGTGDRLFAGKSGLFLWDSAERELFIIEPMRETAVWEPFGRRLGVWISDGLDSGMPETEWHKIVLETDQYQDTQIIVRYYASDDRKAVIGHERVELDAYIHSADIPPEDKLAALNGLWSEPLKDPHDALLVNAKGRYLWICIELIGSRQHAPFVRSLDVHFPRITLLEDLPAIYQRHEPSRDFLARFLSLFKTLLDETDRNIDRVTRSFDADGAPGASLGWLLGWLGIKAGDDWPEEKLRLLLKKAPELHRLRGTRYALEQLIEIYTGEKPIIVEYEQVKPLKENPELGEVADRLYAPDRNSFNVLVKAEHADTETKRVTLQQLIESFKPAFASFKLIILQPWVYMDLHSYLGMNTVLSEPDLLTLDGRKSMPHHTITIDRGVDHRLDHHTRLGIDSRLE